LRADWNEIPSQRMIRTTMEEISARTEHLVAALQTRVRGTEAQFEIADGASLIGGGSTPAQSLSTRVLRIRSKHYSATQLEARLRRGTAPVIARIEEDSVIVDLRTVFPAQEGPLADSLVAALL